jgi:hypothetical protein
VKKNYQNDTTRALTGRATPKKTSNDTGIVAPSLRDGDDGLREWTLPESVTVAMADLAETAKEGLLALAVGTGSQVMAVIMEDDVAALAGPKGRWTLTGWPSVTAATTARSPWAGAGCRWADLGCARRMGARSWPWPATSCSLQLRSWAGWPWRG